MSHFVSLSSQRCASGRLARCLEWLEKECENENVCGMMEMRLALDIAHAERIGCGFSDELDALNALSSLSVNEDKSRVREKCEEMKGRALGCTASFLQREKESTFLNNLLRIKDEIKRDEMHDPSLQQRPDITSTQYLQPLHQAAEIGDPFALFNLGVRNEKRGIAQDKKKAIELFQRAADLGNADAMNKLGVYHYKGNGVLQDKKKSIELYQKAADMGNTDAMFNLAVCYERGEGVSQDKKKAIELYQRASDMGNTDAMVNLGACYDKGNGVSQDKKKAFQLFQDAADMGNTDAMVNLGLHYNKGEGVSQDQKKAIELYRKASDMGNTDAMVNLSLCFFKGNGVSQDKKKAIELFQKASDMGNTGAKAILAVCSASGVGVS